MTLQEQMTSLEVSEPERTSVKEQMQNKEANSDPTKGLRLAEQFVKKFYLDDLDKYGITKPTRRMAEMSLNENLALYKISGLVFNKGENVLDRLNNVYSAMHGLNLSIVFMLHSNGKNVDFYIGTKTVNGNFSDNDDLTKAFEKVFVGNFPGSEISAVKPCEYNGMLQEILPEDGKNAVSSLTSLPALKDDDVQNEQYVQGIEKFIDAMQGEKYSLIIISDPVSGGQIEKMKQGYEELYSEIAPLSEYSLTLGENKGINISLPSLRIDAFSLDVMSQVQDIRKSSLTFAPEAGSQRMRDVINKGLTKDVILKGAWEAFQGGWKRVKLYFMLGLPGETDEDIAAIAELANDIAATYFELPKEERQGRPEITASTSFFVPKPFTPFQWAPMGTAEYFDEKRRFLTGKVREQINQRSIRYICHDAVTSELEGIFARGDRKLSDVIEKAYKKGCIFDAWTDYFRPDVWNELLDELSVDRDFYNYRERNEDEIFPWDFIDIGVSKQFLRREYENAKQGKVTPNCKQKCSGCGAASFHAGICMMDRKASGGSAQ